MMADISDLTEFLDSYPWQRLMAGHMREGLPAMVASRSRNPEQSNADCVAGLVRELQRHCDAYGGYQRYQVILLDGNRERLGELICNLTGQERSRTAAMTTTAASAMVMPEDSEVARVALRLATTSFNHAEHAWRMLGQGYQGMLGSMVAENMRLRERNEALERRDAERREMAEEMTEANHRRQLEVAKHERDTKFRQQLIDKISEVAPYAIAAWSGATPLSKLIESLTPEQFQGVMAVTSPEQQQLLLDLLQKAKRGDIAQQIIAGQRPPLPTPQTQPPASTPEAA